jgi:hypothetical protein
MSEHGVLSHTSEQRPGGDRVEAVRFDLWEGVALNKSSFFVLENSWSTKGAQEFPLGVVIVNSTSIGSVLDETSVVYVGGPTDDRVYAVLSR